MLLEFYKFTLINFLNMHSFFEKLALFACLLLYHRLEAILLLQALIFFILVDSVHLFFRIYLLSKLSIHSVLEFQGLTKSYIWCGSDCRVIERRGQALNKS
jgi:hypothetical protein